ncbi:hypothetical protein HY643_00855 [Candidatus Woesearchaeota archaeon]|nr:hypothetical protein [Candidatus Woesearchaeota archaeon]
MAVEHHWGKELVANILIVAIVFAMLFIVVRNIGGSLTGFVAADTSSSYGFLTSFTPTEALVALILIFALAVGIVVFASFLTV